MISSASYDLWLITLTVENQVNGSKIDLATGIDHLGAHRNVTLSCLRRDVWPPAC